MASAITTYKGVTAVLVSEPNVKLAQSITTSVSKTSTSAWPEVRVLTKAEEEEVFKRYADLLAKYIEGPTRFCETPAIIKSAEVLEEWSNYNDSKNWAGFQYPTLKKVILAADQVRSHPVVRETGFEYRVDKEFFHIKVEVKDGTEKLYIIHDSEKLRVREDCPRLHKVCVVSEARFLPYHKPRRANFTADVDALREIHAKGVVEGMQDPFLTAVTINGRTYYLMPKIYSDGDLNDWLAKYQFDITKMQIRLDFCSQVWNIFEKLIIAGYSHCDERASNFLLDKHPTIKTGELPKMVLKLIDFEASRKLNVAVTAYRHEEDLCPADDLTALKQKDAADITYVLKQRSVFVFGQLCYIILFTCKPYHTSQPEIYQAPSGKLFEPNLNKEGCPQKVFDFVKKTLHLDLKARPPCDEAIAEGKKIFGEAIAEADAKTAQAKK